MQYLSYALPLAALASGAFANPLERRGGWSDGASCTADACLAVVTGKAALGDDGLRGGHCASFLATTVTPPAITETVTITGSSSGDDKWKRASVTVCPNEVPNYASACDESAYSSACACFGYTDVLTTTIAPTTTTKTVYVAPTGAWTVVSGSTCPTPVTSTTTSTVTVGGSGTGSWGSTVTVTVTAGSSGSGHGKGSSTTCPAATTTVTVSGTYSSTSGAPSTSTTTTATPSSCVVTDAIATALTQNFTLLLEYTSYNGTQGAPGRGYKQDVSDATLASDFSDVSDSINFMAGFPVSFSFPPCRTRVKLIVADCLSIARFRHLPQQGRLRLRPRCPPARGQRLDSQRLARLQQRHLEVETHGLRGRLPGQRHQLHDHRQRRQDPEELRRVRQRRLVAVVRPAVRHHQRHHRHQPRGHQEAVRRRRPARRPRVQQLSQWTCALGV